MTDLLTVALPILLIDIANPVLFATTILALTTARPVANALAVILGHTLAYLSAGLLVLFGLAELLAPFADSFLDWFNNPDTLDYVLSLLVGLALLWVALRWRIAPPTPSDTPPEPPRTSLAGAFGFGALVNFIGLPFALPYFAFLGQLLREADGTRLAALALYNLAYALPFLAVPLAAALAGDRIVPWLTRLSTALDRVAAYIMPLMLGLLGLFLLADAAAYFATGTGLI